MAGIEGPRAAGSLGGSGVDGSAAARRPGPSAGLKPAEVDPNLVPGDRFRVLRWRWRPPLQRWPARLGRRLSSCSQPGSAPLPSAPGSPWSTSAFLTLSSSEWKVLQRWSPLPTRLTPPPSLLAPHAAGRRSLAHPDGPAGAYWKHPELLEHNPAGLVPTVLDLSGAQVGGQAAVVTDSLRCVEWAHDFAADDAPGLLPADPWLKALARTEASWVNRQVPGPHSPCPAAHSSPPPSLTLLPAGWLALLALLRGASAAVKRGAAGGLRRSARRFAALLGQARGAGQCRRPILLRCARAQLQHRAPPPPTKERVPPFGI